MKKEINEEWLPVFDRPRQIEYHYREDDPTERMEFLRMLAPPTRRVYESPRQKDLRELREDRERRARTHRLKPQRAKNRAARKARKKTNARCK